ncbi:MAG TPA: bile acid:sodium symporter family protein [Chitinophagaceae bacterium]|jgi:BASS family bile acid:Na+ symporter|nr:bile acid:sodium symporter family protein [Chitinophagaceae bacterium]
MSTSKRSLLFYGLAAAALAAWLVFTLQERHNWAGWPLMLFFLGIALAFRGSKALRGFSYTVMILAAVSLSMYYPQHFRTVGDFKLTNLIIPLLQVIMFGMGTELSLRDFIQVVKMPKGIIVGIICHYTIMPGVGFILANTFNFPPEIAAGIILIGCCPSGLASNVMCYLARANLALSVSVTTISTLVAPFVTPFLMQLLGGNFVEIRFWEMVWHITQIVILPIIAGLLFNTFLHGKFKWLDKVMPLISMGGIMLIIIVITASGRDSLLKIGGLLILATLIHNLSGYFLGYWSGRLLRFPERDCRTIAIEVGMQNGGLASGLATAMGKIATVGLAPAIFGPLMNVTGSSLASWWHNRPPKDEENVEQGISKEELRKEIGEEAVS